MRTTNPFHDGAEDMAREFKRAAEERAAEFEAEEVAGDGDEPSEEE